MMSSSMNGDVMMEILASLPAKTLVKFKSVSRNWYSLISSHQFRRLHTLRHPKPPPSLLLLHRTTSNLYYLDPLLPNQNHLKPYTFNNIIPNPNPNPNPRILSSCNGLMLLRSDRYYYVHNPTTNQSRNISTIRNHDVETKVMGLCLAFDPSISIHYKIVFVVKPTPDHFAVEVYSSESETWEQRSETFTAPAEANFRKGVYCNNAIHWETSETCLEHRFGLYYDIPQNVVGNLPPLDFSTGSGSGSGSGVIIMTVTLTMSIPCRLQELNARLNYVVKVDDCAGRQHLAVYELSQDYSRWCLKDRRVFNSYFYTSGMHNLVTGNDGETRIVADHAPGIITAYRLGSDASEELVYYADQLLYSPDNLLVYQFGESLAPV